MTAAASAGRASEDWRVAFLVHRFPVISETFVSTLAADIKPHVREFRILATDGEIAPEPHHRLVREARLLDDLHVARQSGRADFGRMLELGRARRDKAGVLAGLVLLDRFAPRHLLALTRLMAAQGPFDITHCQFGYEGLAALRHLRFGTLRTRALVVHLRGFDITQFVRERGPQVYRRLFRTADLFIANCHHFRQTAEGLGCPPEKLTVIGSPIDTDRFAPPAMRMQPEGRPLRIVAVGRLVEKKGLGDAIAAMARLGSLDARLEILGDGPLRHEFEAQIAAARLGERVVLRGSATQDEVIEALHAADIALAPSVRASSGDEDAPVNTLKEAMATGLPVIATQHGGIPELVRPGENGTLVPERDPEALAAAIENLASRPEDWHRLGANGRRKVVSEFGRPQVASRTLDAYAHALERSGGQL